MRTSLVLAALVVPALAAAYGCTLPLQGLSADGNGGAAPTSTASTGGAGTSATSAGGAPTTTSGGTTGGTGGVAHCAVDGDCKSSGECTTVRCVGGVCLADTASHDGKTCGSGTPPACYDASQCAAGVCTPVPTMAFHIDDGVHGNCFDMGCDGLGNATKVPNDQDPPDDDNLNDCMVQKCNNGASAKVMVAEGDDCGIGKCCGKICCTGGGCVKSVCCAGPSCGSLNPKCCDGDESCVVGTCCPTDKVCGFGLLCCGSDQSCTALEVCF